MDSVTIQTIISVAGIIVNLVALLIAVTRVLAASTATEVRTAERFAGLETKMERVETDIQNLFRATPKRLSDH